MDGRRYAVLIGNGSFPGDDPDGPPRLPSLQCPTADVGGLRELLEATPHGGYAVTQLIDRPHSEARRAIYECLKKAGPDDQVVIYYSGHGNLDENGNLYLAGSDTDPASLDPTALAAADVQKYVGESKAAARIVILDCCFSGAVERVFRHGTAKGEIADQAGQAVRALEGRGVFYLTASTDTQAAEEKDQDRYSLLTKHIIDGIRDGAADTDDDGAISFSELCAFVQKAIRLEGAQRPLSFTLKAYGDPVVAFTGRPALAARRDAIEQEIYELRRLKMLQGADAARILDWIHRPATETIDGTTSVQAVIQALYLARSDAAMFLKTLHGFASQSPAREAAAPRPVPPEHPPAPAAPERDQADRSASGFASAFLDPMKIWRPASVVVVSLAAIGLIAVGVWNFYAPGRSDSQPARAAVQSLSPLVVPAPAALDSPANAAAPNAAAPLVKSTGTQLVNPGTSLITPGTPLLNAPAKKQ
jgi:hypothetical protein